MVIYHIPGIMAKSDTVEDLIGHRYYENQAPMRLAS